MAKPILLSVDDDSGVLRAIERDLRSQYGAEYRVIGSDSPEGALEVLKQLKVRNDNVALLLADQRMPNMDGVEFLQAAMRIYPEAKRALLTAYADTNAAISAINDAGINYFFLKPWDPPTERLYPQLDYMLDDWQASYKPSFEGIRVLGTRWSPKSYELRDFLARNHVPYQWIDVELSANDPETKRLLEVLGPEVANLPVVLFPDGTKLLETLPAQVAQKVGLRTRGRALPNIETGRRQRALLSCIDDCHRSSVEAAESSGGGPSARRRRVLRRRRHRSSVVQRRSYLYCRRRKLCRTSRNELCQICRTRFHPGPWQFARKQHVAVPH